MAAAASSSTAPAGSPYRSRFGDTTQTKVFVGGLAWETPSEGLRQHFEQYGDILEAVVITDRLTGRSKGYGFVTFLDAEAARRAVQDPNPMITGRRANCNIASLGPPRPAQAPRGRAYPGAHMQGMQSPAPHYFARAPQPQMGLMPQPQHHGPAIYNHHSQQYGYWYPPDYQYQQVMMNSQALQHYHYAQMYGLAASPTAPAPPPYHQQYLGYVPTPSPRGAVQLSPAPQIAAQPYVPLQAAAQMQGSFVQLPSLPHNFALQLPPHAVSSMLPPNPADSQTAGGQAYSAAYPAAPATNPNNAHQGA